MAKELLCRVRPGQQLAHLGQVLEEGAEVTLPITIAHEVRHLVDEVVGASVRAIGQSSTFEADLNAARPHERVSILERQEAELVALLDGVRKQLTLERKAQERSAPKSAPAKPAAEAVEAKG